MLTEQSTELWYEKIAKLQCTPVQTGTLGAVISDPMLFAIRHLSQFLRYIGEVK